MFSPRSQIRVFSRLGVSDCACWFPSIGSTLSLLRALTPSGKRRDGYLKTKHSQTAAEKEDHLRPPTVVSSQRTARTKDQRSAARLCTSSAGCLRHEPGPDPYT